MLEPFQRLLVVGLRWIGGVVEESLIAMAKDTMGVHLDHHNQYGEMDSLLIGLLLL